MSAVTFGSVCSGIEAASVAWHPLGWRAVWLAEIEPFPCALLAHRYPDVPNLGDMTKIADMVRSRAVAAPDVLVGGTPCQAFSIAGLRNSLGDARGQLSLSFVDLANAIDATRAVSGLPPAVIVWENVPGVLSTADNAFGCFLAGLAGEDEPVVPAGKKWTNAGCVFGPQRAVAWRVLDAQYFGVAQRRRRVFVVASAREGFDPAAVLLEFDGVRRDSAPRREAREDTAAGTLRSTDGGSDVDHARSGHLQPVAGTLQASGKAAGSATQQDAEAGMLVPIAFDSRQECISSTQVFGALGSSSPQAQAVCFAENSRGELRLEGGDGQRTGALSTGGGKPGQGMPVVCITGEVTHTLKAEGFDASEDGTGRGQPIVAAMAFQERGRTEGTSVDTSVEVAYALLAPSGGSRSQERNILTPQMAVRRLTPRECERLQSFPDDYTRVPVRGKPAADGPRYKALGNSMCVYNMRWIGRRIDAHLRAHSGSISQTFQENNTMNNITAREVA